VVFAYGISAALFGLGHIYLGRTGVVRTGIIGALMSAIVALTASLFPAMLLHAVADITSVSYGYVVCAEDR
jgi:membrane protease YdiL (CAAX protease family)